MENEPEVIRRQMNETRASLTEKLETLEQQVVGTVQEATASVTETVESVRDAVKNTVATVQGSVRETVDTVKDTFDVSQAVSRHPWIAVGCSAFAGYFVGSLLRNATTPPCSPQPSRHPIQGSSNGTIQPFLDSGRPGLAETKANGRSHPGLLATLGQTFDDESRRLRGLAIAAALGAARDFIIRQVPPSIAPQLAEIVDSATAKLGGKPIRGPILPQSEPTTDRF